MANIKTGKYYSINIVKIKAAVIILTAAFFIIIR